MRFVNMAKADNSSWAADMSASRSCTANSFVNGVFSTGIARFAVSVFLCISDLICNIILSLNGLIIINLLKSLKVAGKSQSLI